MERSEINRLILVRGSGFDPYRNLAVERVLTETVEPGCCVLYLWQNQDTVVIGRNQNAYKECRLRELERDGGHLARRLSGGGAVYHDLGNLNFTFCLCRSGYDLLRQQRILIDACRMLGVPAELNGRNDILSDGRKFSGHSFYFHEGRAFHNGTFLISTDFSRMEDYLCPSRLKWKGKNVASVHSRVVNLTEIVPDITPERMGNAIAEACEREFGRKAEIMRESELEQSRVLEEAAHFEDPVWIYGSSEPFSVSFSDRFSWGIMEVEIEVTEGRCAALNVYTDALDTEVAEAVRRALTGCRYDCDSIFRALVHEDGLKEYMDDMMHLFSDQIGKYGSGRTRRPGDN